MIENILNEKFTEQLYLKTKGDNINIKEQDMRNFIDNLRNILIEKVKIKTRVGLNLSVVGYLKYKIDDFNFFIKLFYIYQNYINNSENYKNIIENIFCYNEKKEVENKILIEEFIKTEFIKYFLRNGEEVIISFKENGIQSSTEHKFIIKTKPSTNSNTGSNTDSNTVPSTVPNIDPNTYSNTYYTKLFNPYQPTKQQEDLKLNPIELLNINFITWIVENSDLSITTCGMTVIENQENPEYSMIVTKQAENPLNICFDYIYKTTKLDDSKGYPQLITDENLLVSIKKGINPKIVKSGINNKCSITNFLKTSSIEIQKTFIQGIYDTLALMSIMDMFDVRFHGNILVNEKTGQLQIIDFDIKNGLTLNGYGEYNITAPKIRKCLQGKTIAQDISELCINSHFGTLALLDCLGLFLEKIITNTPNFKQKDEKAEYNIKEQEELVEFLKYKEKIAESMLKIKNCINKRYYFLKQKRGITNLELKELIFLEQRQHNIINLFEYTVIGNKAKEKLTERQKERLENIEKAYTECENYDLDITDFNFFSNSF